MTMYGLQTLAAGNNQLQNTLSATTSGEGELPLDVRHHPITCPSRLYFNLDGSFCCDHGRVPPDDARTRACVNHSIALLIFDEAKKL